MTPNEKREVLDMDISENTLLDNIYIPSNLVPIEKAGATKPIVDESKTT